jgi:hypothetical protein
MPEPHSQPQRRLSNAIHHSLAKPAQEHDLTSLTLSDHVYLTASPWRSRTGRVTRVHAIPSPSLPPPCHLLDARLHSLHDLARPLPGTYLTLHDQPQSKEAPRRSEEKHARDVAAMPFVHASVHLSPHLLRPSLALSSRLHQHHYARKLADILLQPPMPCNGHAPQKSSPPRRRAREDTHWA